MGALLVAPEVVVLLRHHDLTRHELSTFGCPVERQRLLPLDRKEAEGRRRERRQRGGRGSENTEDHPGGARQFVLVLACDQVPSGGFRRLVRFAVPLSRQGHPAPRWSTAADAERLAG